MLLDSLRLLSLCLTVACGGTIAEEPDPTVFRMAVYIPHYDPPEDINAVMAYVMAQRGYRTEFPLVPSRRMPWSLANGSIDTFQDSIESREARRTRHEQNFIRSKYPIFCYKVLVYYKPSERWRPDSPDDKAAFKTGRGVSINYTYFELQGYDITLVPHWDSGARMVNSGRADFWVDSFPDFLLGHLLRQEEDGYRVGKYMDSPLFLYFRDTERGRHFREVWDTEIEKLYRSGDLYRQVYLEHSRRRYYQYALDPFLDYLRRTYPEFSDIQ